MNQNHLGHLLKQTPGPAHSDLWVTHDSASQTSTQAILSLWVLVLHCN